MVICEMAFKFENLQVWERALDLTIQVNELASSFPKFELFSLSSQIRRAADSVVLNISEGCTGLSNAELKRFLRYSLRSSLEVVSCLFIAKRKGYINEQSFNNYYIEYEILCKMLNKFISSLD